MAVLVVLAFLWLHQLSSVTSCNIPLQIRIAGRTNFTVERYLGEWNLIGYVDNDSTVPRRCVSERYDKSSLENPFLLDTTWSGIVDDVPLSQNGIIAMSGISDGQSQWDFYMDGAKFNTYILATNYDVWALEFACSSEHNFNRFMIRSRSRTLNLEIVEVLKVLISGYGYDGDSLTLVDQTNCS